MPKKLLFLTVILTVQVTTTMADQVALKNGDRLTGEIVQLQGDKLKLTTAYAGTVEILWSEIESVSSAQPLYLTLSDDQMIVGLVTMSADNAQVSTTDTGTVNVARANIQSIRSRADYAAYQAEIEKLRNPGLLDLWGGTADVGLSLTQGNADTTTMAMGFKAARATSRDKTTVFATSVYARNSTSGVAVTTANAVRGGARYDVDVSQKSFIFGLGELEFDEFQRLDLRMTLGGGMGWHAFKTENTVFDVFGGGAFAKEYFSNNVRRSSAEIMVGQEFSYKFSGRTSFSERLVFLPNVSETGDYRLNFDLGAVTSLSTWLGWHITFSDRYLSNPVPGAQANDMLLSTGLRFTF